MSVSLGDLIVTLKGVAGPLLSAVDESKKAMQDMGAESTKTDNIITRNWKEISAATVAMGAAFEGFARSQADSNAALSRVAIVTGETTEALRESIKSMVDYTFSAHDAARAMDDLVSRGIRTKDQFEAILPVVDTLADALGMDIVDVIDIADNALSALGIPLENVGDHMDTITFLAKQTTVEMSALAKTFRNEAPAINDLGLSFDDVAVAMAAMEAEGRRGPAAVRGFQEAIKAADGDVTLFWESLGVANSTLDTQRQSLADAAGLTQKYADANNAVATPLQRLQANLSNLLFQFGGLSSILGQVAPFMMALGPTVSALAAAKSALIPVIVSLGAAFKALTAIMLANPFGLIVAALAAIGVALYVLIDDWTFMTEFLGRAWQYITDLFNRAVSAVVGAVQDMGRMVLAVFESLFPKTAEVVTSMVNSVVSLFVALRDRAVQIINDLFGGVIERIRAMASAVVGFVSGMVDRVAGLFGMGKKQVADEIVPAMASDVVRQFSQMSDQGQAISAAMASGVVFNVSQMREGVDLQTGQMVAGNNTSLNAMLSDSVSITRNMSNQVLANQAQMAGEWRVVTQTTTAQTAADYDKMATDVTGIIKSMTENKLDTFSGFSKLWLSGVGDLVTQTLDKFGSMGKGISGILSSVFGGSSGGGGSIAGAAGTAIGSLFGPIGGAVGGVLGKTIGKIFKFADGGVVTAPTLGLMAEAGESEAVIPLSRFESMMHGMYARGSDSGGANVAGEIRSLRQSFEMMTAEVVYNTNRLLKIEEDWNRNGQPGVRNERLVGLV